MVKSCKSWWLHWRQPLCAQLSLNISTLLSNITNPKTLFGIESSLIAIGYICEEVKSETLQKRSNEILTAVIEGMKHKNDEIKFAASESFYNSLEYVHKNFEVKVNIISKLRMKEII